MSKMSYLPVIGHQGNSLKKVTYIECGLQIDTCVPFPLYLRNGFCSESEQPDWNRVIGVNYKTRTTIVVSNGRYTFYQIPFIKYFLSNIFYQIPFIKYHNQNIFPWSIYQISLIKYHLSNTFYQILFAVKKIFLINQSTEYF